ncbi:hypothetical protein AVEN_92562-1 [Araneus ventricosus]|uniref:Uncharacterized protein n=1 Tax=Araneus ventricosus TaxID=182803 RepID=A0A4Y2AJB5_ARAVE|nr:hypothetical protein AVEN_92562-1 [Araneus ventricosus]
MPSKILDDLAGLTTGRETASPDSPAFHCVEICSRYLSLLQGVLPLGLIPLSSAMLRNSDKLTPLLSIVTFVIALTPVIPGHHMPKCYDLALSF